MAVKQECEHTEQHIICPQCDDSPREAQLEVFSRGKSIFDSSCPLCPHIIYEGTPIVLVKDDFGKEMWVHEYHAKEPA